MKSALCSIVCAVLLAVSANAQTARNAPHTPEVVSYDVGGRAVGIPAPDNFTDTVTDFPRIAGRLVATESPHNEVLAVHVTDEILPQLQNGAEPDLPLYTKASVLREMKSVNIEPLDYEAVAAEFEKQSPGALKDVVKLSEKSAGERLSKHWGTETGLKIGETRLLGHFDKQPNSISSMFLMDAEVFRRKFLILGSMSLVYVNKRILYLYVFRIAQSVNDRDLVANITKAWTAKTVAANN